MEDVMQFLVSPAGTSCARCSALVECLYNALLSIALITEGHGGYAAFLLTWLRLLALTCFWHREAQVSGDERLTLASRWWGLDMLWVITAFLLLVGWWHDLRSIDESGVYFLVVLCMALAFGNGTMSMTVCVSQLCAPTRDGLHRNRPAHDRLNQRAPGNIDLPVLLGASDVRAAKFRRKSDDDLTLRVFLLREQQLLMPNFQSSCCICLSDLRLHDVATELRCHHIFHTECINAWLCSEEPSRRCPLRCQFAEHATSTPQSTIAQAPLVRFLSLQRPPDAHTGLNV
eukprot:TRINITY_DN33801_c0_g1_i1.p1 TRINITY_DN33801_c0_g1~~TRINITY_DN33801_c0_g1_i1.p1  ORF type:complete len:287 (-),score=28.54 TRINITY_DN33801_c0_g1_i1:435-1295(-)